MNENINFYSFMHKQILVVILLLLGTAPGYILMGYLYTSMILEVLWFALVVLFSIYGFTLYKKYDKFEMSIQEKDYWLNRVRVFIFLYFYLWTIMFLLYVLSDNIVMHYMAIATQLGCAVVAATILASQKKLVLTTVIGLMLPITIYLLLVGHIYSYLLAFFTVVLSVVLLYAAKNTHDYLFKSRYQAYYDHLTKLGNRRYFLEILNSILSKKTESFAYLLLIDLDYFKTINDTLGHDVGDKLLYEVALRMQNLCVKSSNRVSRLGGDEFCVISSSFSERKECLKNANFFATELLEVVKERYYIDEHSLYISASVGLSIMSSDELSSSDYLKEADMAMYEAKGAGRDGVILFNDALKELVEKKLNIERLLHFAIDQQEMSLHYQPQVDMSRKVVGCEVLVRWNSKELGSVGPDLFIPIAESTGYIIELGRYILEESFKSIQEFAKLDLGIKQVSINISMRQLQQKDFVEMVQGFLAKYFRKKSKIAIVFEITETAASEDLSSLVAIINRLAKYNISFSMDDFGTGYSSLSYLQEIPISELKIDQSFVSKLSDVKQASLVKTIIDISKNFYLLTVAEGVEEEHQREYLEELGCDLYQGYLFSKALPKEEFIQFCTK